jgi:uncharacterized protein (DUF342 family)
LCFEYCLEIIPKKGQNGDVRLGLEILPKKGQNDDVRLGKPTTTLKSSRKKARMAMSGLANLLLP